MVIPPLASEPFVFLIEGCIIIIVVIIIIMRLLVIVIVIKIKNRAMFTSRVELLPLWFGKACTLEGPAAFLRIELKTTKPFESWFSAHFNSNSSFVRGDDGMLFHTVSFPNSNMVAVLKNSSF